MNNKEEGMTLRKVLIWTFLIVCGILIIASPSKTHAVNTVELKDGTLVILRVQETINPEVMGPGDIVKLEVAEDVKVDNKVVIERGTPAIAEVVTAEKKGYVGKAGRIALAVRSTTAVDGQKVPLRGTIRREGEEKVGTSVAVSVIVCPLALLMKGESATIPAGSEVKAYVDSTLQIKVN